MPEILKLKTDDWTLVVWTKDIELPRRRLAATLAVRDKSLPVSVFKLSPSIGSLKYSIEGGETEEASLPDSLTTPLPIFFENRPYEFDFQFSDTVDSSFQPEILHWLNSIVDSFHSTGSSLRGTINFGNDVGWARLGLKYKTDSTEIAQFISFEVLPTKMDLEGDFNHIHRVIDQTYPLWRFSFAQKTDQTLSRTRKPHERFFLLWLANFRSIREELEDAVGLICRSPHSRLLPEERFLRPDRLKGRLSTRLEERVVHQCREGEVHRRHRVETKKLSVDTPENQFVKMVLSRCVRELSVFLGKARQNNNQSDKERLSESFFSELESWYKPLRQRLAEPLFREVGDFNGLNGESLVLHHRAGYAKVYRIWHELKLYLDLFGRDASISLKSISELYEVWCFLEIRRVLLDELNFEEALSRKSSLWDKGFEKDLKDGIGAAFKFTRPDGLMVRLAHEPRFSSVANPKAGNIYSWTTTQIPDIFLEATFPSGERIRWIFDAKYRTEGKEGSIDLIPDDAINQMHRYRDALIHLSEADDGVLEKSRPVVGAFVLYPGCFDEEAMANPYAEAIDAVGIGGFPLLPGANNLWLESFLRDRLGDLSGMSEPYPEATPDIHYLREPVRIYSTGLTGGRYRDLTLVAQPRRHSEVYIDGFRNGCASWYHVPVDTTVKKKISRAMMREVKHCALAVHYPGVQDRRIEYLYDVLSVKIVKRKEMTVEQAGRVDLENEADYWLLELGPSRQLHTPVFVPGIRGFRFRLTDAKKLLKSAAWDELPSRYASV